MSSIDPRNSAPCSNFFFLFLYCSKFCYLLSASPYLVMDKEQDKYYLQVTRVTVAQLVRDMGMWASVCEFQPLM